MPSKKPSNRDGFLGRKDRCQYTTAIGRQCQMQIQPGHKTLCPQHALQENQLRNADKTAAELLGPLDDFRSAQAVNRALGKLFSLTAKGRIPVRNAAVLSYIGQLLLQSLRPVRDEIIDAGGTKDLEVIYRDILAMIKNEMETGADPDLNNPIPFTSPRRKKEKRREAATESRRARIRDGMTRLVAGGYAKESDLQKFDPESSEQEEENEEEETVEATT